MGSKFSSSIYQTNRKSRSCILIPWVTNVKYSTDAQSDDLYFSDSLVVSDQDSDSTEYISFDSKDSVK